MVLVSSACGLEQASTPGVSYGTTVAKPPLRLKGKGGPQRAGEDRPKQVQVPQTRALPTMADLGFQWPVGTRAQISSPFGWRQDPFTRAQRFHHGVDILCWLGESVGASNRGTVIWAGRARVYGNTVVLAHDYGLLTIYAHLREVTVDVGRTVKTGKQVGTCGSSGRSTGPHLHLEVRHGSNVYDPLSFLP